MKRSIALFVTLIFLLMSSAVQARGGGGGHSSGSSHSYSSSSGTSDHFVHGYTKKDGTVVQGYHATNPNGTKNDNYSTRGNTNPYTGKEGKKPRDGE